MAFQALLFCPDDKTARIVTQVLSELEFNVEGCTEPFAAVKKLMGGHFDALVVDCDNEQNATLLFKSARNSTSNQTSLAVAIVEGQAGVAKAFRIGANLVLTKPINVEQSKGTLRVARGLLRKGEPGKPAMAAPAAPAAPVATAPAPVAKPAAPRPVAPAAPPQPPKPAVPPAPAPVIARRPVPPPVVEPPVSVAAAQAAASSGLADPDDVLESKAPAVPAPRPEMRLPFVGAPEGPAASFGGAASAPARARESVHVPDVATPRAPHKAEDLFEKPAEPAHSAPVSAEAEHAPAPAPLFTFGGANAPEESRGAGKKALLGIAAMVLVGATLYVGWTHFPSLASRQNKPEPASVLTPPAATPTTNRLAPAKPSASAPAGTQPVLQPTAPGSLPKATTDDAQPDAEDNAPADSRTTIKTPASVPPASKPAAAAKPAEAAPLVVKGGAVPAIKSQPAAPDAPDPDVIGIPTTGSGGALSNLVGTGDAPLHPVLQTVNISQGVSQGLLLKKVQPVYPRTALNMHIEGIVELMATISKTGDITSIRVLTGDKQLTAAAVDAVKQWKYKPYLLNGEPVEIQTQVTISFKLPH